MKATIKTLTKLVHQGILTLLFLCVAIGAQAGVLYWDADGTGASGNPPTAGVGGAGTWNTTSNRWWNGTSYQAWANNSVADFRGTAGTVTLTNSVAADGLVIANSSTWSIATSGAGLLTLNNVASNIVFSGSGPTVPGTLAGALNIVGTADTSSIGVRFSGANTGVTNTTINFTSGNGIIDAASTSVFGSAGAKVTLVNGRIYLDVNAGGTYNNWPTTLGGGIFRVRNANTTVGVSTYPGNFTVTNNANIAVRAAAGNGLNCPGTISLNSGTLTFSVGDGSSGIDLQNTISGTGSITLAGNGQETSATGSGVVKLSAANTFSGTATVSAGTLALNNLNALQNATLNTGAASTNNFVTFTVAGSNTYNLGALAGSQNLTNNGNTLSVGTKTVDTTFSGAIVGAGGLTKVGTNTLTLSGINTYMGNTVVSGGTLAVRLPMVSTNLAMANGVSLTVNVNNNSWSSLTDLTVTNNVLTFNFGNLTGTPTTPFTAVVLNSGGSNVVKIAGTGFAVGDVTLIAYTSKTGLGTFNLDNTTLPTGMAGYITDTGSAIVLHVTAPSIQDLVWSGANNDIWQTNGGALWNGNTAVYQEYPSGSADKVTFNDTDSGVVVNIGSVVKPAALVVSTTNYFGFNGSGVISGTNPITKSGTGYWAIANNNDFSGTLTVNAGSIYVNSANALGSTNGPTVVNSGGAVKLGVGGAVTVTGEPLTIVGTGTDVAYGALRAGNGATGPNVWDGPVILGADGARIGAEDGGSITVSGNITDNGTNYSPLFRAGIGSTVTISGTANSWGGVTRTFGSDGVGNITSKILLGVANAFPTNRQIQIANCTLDLNSNNQICDSLGITAGGTPLYSTLGNSGSTATLTLNSTNNSSFSGNITGAVALDKQGTNTVTLSGVTLDYTGATTVSAGRLNLTGTNTLGTSITVAGGATLGGEFTTTGSLTLSANSAVVVDPATAGSLTANTIDASTSPVTVVFTGAVPAGSNVLVLTATTSPNGITGSAANFQASGVRGGTFTIENSGTELHFTASAATTLTWKGNDATNPTFWDTLTTTNWLKGVTPDQFWTGDYVTFDDSASTNNVVVQGASIAPGNVTFSNSIDYTVSGGGIVGSAGLVKLGSGTLVLSNANTYTAGTAIKNGVIQVAGGNDRLPAAGAVVLGDTTSSAKLVLGNASAARNQTVSSLSTTGLGGSVVGGNSANSTLTINNTNTLDFAGLLGGTNVNENNLGLTKGGAGVLTLSQTNTYLGATTISGGTLLAVNAATFGRTNSLSMSGTGVLDLGGFDGNFANISASTSGNAITNSGAGAGTNMVTVTGLTTSIAALVADDGNRVIAMNLAGANSMDPLINANNTFSGGLNLGNSIRIQSGNSSPLTGGKFGKGTITIGTGAQLYYNSANTTIGNDIIVNDATSNNGSRSGTFRVDTAGNVLSGTITANQAPATFNCGGGIGGISLTGKVTGTNGLAVGNPNGTSMALTLNTTSGLNDYQGSTTVANTTATLALGASDQIPNGAGKGNVSLTGTLDMGGFDETINGLSGAGTVDNLSAANANNTLTLGDGNPTNTFSGAIKNTAGSLALTKIGTGTQTLSGTNLAYSGATTVSDGKLIISTTNALGTSSITVAGGATLDTEATTAGLLTLSANSTLVANAATPGCLTAASVDATASPIKVGFSTAPGLGASVLVLSSSSAISGSASNFQAYGVRSGGSFYLTNSDTQLYYVAPVSAPTLTWRGNDTANPTFWDVVTTTNWLNGASPDLFYTGDAVLFNDTAATNNVVIQGSSVSPSSVTLSNSALAYTVSGGAIASGDVVKLGSGTVTLSAANTYTGTTTVKDGVIAIQNNSALGATAGGVYVTNSGTLDLGSAMAQNALNLGAKMLTISGTGFGGNGTLINSGTNYQINAVQKVTLAANASIGGPGTILTTNGTLSGALAGRWDIRGASSTLDMGGNTLTKVGSNYVALVGTVVTNPGNIVVTGGGALAIQTSANMGGSAANTLTVNNDSVLEFYNAANAVSWSLALNSNSTVWAESGSGANNTLTGPVTLNGPAILQADAVLNIAGNITDLSGNSSLAKYGGNTATLSGSNSYAGGTLITNGILVAATNSALGTGTVTINRSATRLVINDGVTLSNTIVFNGGGASSRGVFENSGSNNATLAGATITINGTLFGGGHFASVSPGTLTVSSAIISTITNNVVSRIGTVIFAGGGSYNGFAVAQGTARLGANNGLCTTSIVDIASSAAAFLDLAGYNQTLAGIIRSTSNGAVITNSATGTNSTLTLTGTSAYPGLIKDSGVSGGRIALDVNGGSLTLSGANTYSGGTVVTNGTLAVNTTTAAGTGAILVQNGGTLGGNGIVSGAATLEAGSLLAPGNNGIGTLTFSNGLAIGGNVAVELNKSLTQSNDLVSVTGSLNNTGTGQLIVSNLGPALVVGDKFTLFSQPVANGNLLTLAGPAGVTFTNDLAVDGSITVLTVAPTTPPMLNFTNLGGNQLQFAWTGSGILQSQTNGLSTGLSTNWGDYPGGGTSPVTVTIDPSQGSVFFRVKQ